MTSERTPPTSPSDGDLPREAGCRPHRVAQGPITIEYWPLSALQRAPKNPKSHALDVLRQGMARWGYTEPVIVDERTGRLLAGHGRLEELERAKAAGAPAPARVVVDGDEWFIPVVKGIATENDSEATALLVADNQSVVAGGWIDPILAEVLQEIACGPQGLAGVGFDRDDVDALVASLGDAAQEGLTDPDSIPSPRETALKPGDLIQLGDHRLLCGDATNAAHVARLLAGEPVDLVVTSPPYNVGIKYRQHADRQARGQYLAFIEAAARVIVAVLRPGRFVAWNIGVSPKTLPAHQVVRLEAAGLQFYRQIVWAKTGVAYPVFPSTLRSRRTRHYRPNYVHELVQVFEKLGDPGPREPCPRCEGHGEVFTFDLPLAEAHETIQLLISGREPELGPANKPDTRYQNDVWHISQAQATVDLRTVAAERTRLQHDGRVAHMVKEHPAAFPAELPRALMAFLTASGEAVLDPFGGAGTTLIACEQMGRRGFLVELDPVYCQVTVDRWERFAGQTAKVVEP